LPLHLLVDLTNERLIDAQHQDTSNPKSWKQIEAWSKHRRSQIPNLVRVAVSGGAEPKVRLYLTEDD